MGGTSTDISLIYKGELRMTTEGGIDELPVKVPMIEINTIGAGAGSIAWLDDWNGLHVGPHSAGADPGPAAYKRGGTEPTVTDANLVLGRMHPDRFVGGDMSVDLAAAREAIQLKIADPLEMTVEEAAAGIIRIANANMERALRVSSAEKGFDPRDITLLAFGGAGPMHAAALATAVGIPEVLVPEHPGVFSAVGLVMSDIRHDFGQTRVLRGKEISGENLNPLFGDLDKEANEALERDGVAEDHRDLQRSADLRYVGQAYEVNVTVPSVLLDDESAGQIIQNFHDLHQQLYAHHHPDKPVEFVSGRVAAIGLMSAPELQRRTSNGSGANPKESRHVYFDELSGYVDTDVYDRRELSAGSQFDGPAIVEQTDTTTVIHPGQRARIDELGNLMIAIGE
jgi:N-methylhydantoinase A